MTRWFLIFSLFLATITLAAGETDYGKPHPKANPKLVQYDFLKGKWDIDVNWKKPSGELLQYKGGFTCTWQVAGTVFQQEWKGPYTTGLEMRSYNRQTGKLEGYNIYAGSGWVLTTSEFKDGLLIVLANNPTGKFINRETYFNIQKDSFEMKSERSYDEGKTWVEGSYTLKATRVE